MSSYLPTSNIFTSSSNGIDPYKIATGQQHVDPELFKMYLAASMTNLDSILNSSSDNGENSDNNFLGTDLFNSNYTGSTQSSSIFSSSDLIYEQMIAQANLIGKNVEAYDPDTKQIFTEKVTGVAVSGGRLYITVGGKKIPPENLISIKE